MKKFIKQNKTFVYFIIFYSILLIFSIDNDPKNFANHAYHLEKAKLMSDGNGYSSIGIDGIVPESSITKFFFAFMISGVLKLFGNSFFYPRLFVAILSILSLILMYFIFEKRLSKKKRLLLISLTALNFHYFTYSGFVETEIPYIFFTFICIYLFDLYLKKEKISIIFFIGIFTVFTYLTRFIGMSLFIAILLHLILNKTKKKLDFEIIKSNLKNTVFYGIISSIILIIWSIRNKILGIGGIASNYLSPWMIFTPDWNTEKTYEISIIPIILKIIINIVGYLYFLPNLIFNGILSLKLNNFAHTVLESNNKLNFIINQDLNFLIYLGFYFFISFILISIIFFGYFNQIKKKITIIETYLFFNVAILMLYSDRVPRFLVALIPLIIYYLIKGMDKLIKNKIISKKIVSIFYIFLIIFSILSVFKITYEYKTNTEYDPNMKDFFDMALWANENIDSNSIILTNGKIGLAFFTNLIELPIRTIENSSELFKYIDDNNVNYIIVDSLENMEWVHNWKYRTKKNIIPTINKHPENFKEVHKIENTILYEYDKNKK